MSKKAVLMMTFGSPEVISYEAVAEFFTNIRRGVRPEEDEIKTLYDNYVRIGGTPLQTITKEEMRLIAEIAGFGQPVMGGQQVHTAVGSGD